MRGFLLGLLTGIVGTLWYTQTRGQLEVNRHFGEMQERANAILNESRRILEETRQELGSALQAGRQTVQQQTERLRHAGTGTAESNPPEGTEQTPPAM
ncbi:MAG TPA: hypothetical protein VKX96_13295 [Chloroflexota bacterium]|nr:hypothetical protein [Chloroflexota bacterium]